MHSIAYIIAEVRRIRILKENGFNTIRCAHNPPSDECCTYHDRLLAAILPDDGADEVVAEGMTDSVTV